MSASSRDVSPIASLTNVSNAFTGTSAIVRALPSNICVTTSKCSIASRRSSHAASAPGEVVDEAE